MMEFEAGPLPGCFIVRLKRFGDDRGSFVKTFSHSLYEKAGLKVDLQEEFYSTSAKGVVRGMHFQTPPYDHVKMVYCAQGAVDDVLVDLRRGSGFGQVKSVRLDAAAPVALFIARGIAHGFESLTDNSLMVYKTSTEHAPEHDCGVRWDSIDYRWKTADPVLSARDQKHPLLADFVSPFTAEG